MNVQELLQSVVNQAGARTVYGEPVTAEGLTVIPVAKIGYGFGMGSGPPDKPGSGGGGGLRAKPAGVIQVAAEGTRFIPIHDYGALGAAFAAGVLAGLLLGTALSRE